MKTKMIRAATAVLLLGAFVSARAGGDEAKPAGKCTTGCPALLKGVAHLRDNDIRLARKGGGVVFVDPTSGPADPLSQVCKLVKPDLILITHAHADHFAPAVLQEYVKANPQVVIAGPADVAQSAAQNGIPGVKVVAPNQAYTLVGFEFTTVPAYFEGERNHPRKNGWVGYVLPLNGTRYYVTGDTGPTTEMETTKTDVIFTLLSGCGGNISEALTMAKLSGAKLVVPVHTSGQVPTIKNFIAQLPGGVKSAYFLNGTLAPKS
jgi:L-ascorbate metabolism protein UlaG (beta-lactamase superfamily)